MSFGGSSGRKERSEGDRGDLVGCALEESEHECSILPDGLADLGAGLERVLVDVGLEYSEDWSEWAPQTGVVTRRLKGQIRFGAGTLRAGACFAGVSSLVVPNLPTLHRGLGMMRC